MIEEKGFLKLKDIEADKVNKELIEWCDVVFALRSTESFYSHLFKYVRKKGIYVIESLDDDFLLLDSGYGSEGQGFWWGRKKALIKAMKNADCLITPNKNLSDKYSKLGGIKDVYVSNTPMDTEGFIKPTVRRGKVKIVYYVNDGTTGMFEKYIRPALPYIADKMADKVAFYFMALHPDLSEYDGKIEYHYVAHMTFPKFLQYLRDEKFDIGLAPLDDSGFSKSKYINKYVEYTRAGVAGIYSDCELYRGVIENEYNGVLCKGAGDNWGKAISKLVENPWLRLSIANNAQKYAEDKLNKDKVLEGIIQGVPALANYKAPEHSVSAVYLGIIKLYYKLFFRPCGWIYTVYCCTKNGKANVIVGRVKRKLLKRT